MRLFLRFLLGLGAGALLSVLPLEIAIVAIPAAALWALISIGRAASARRWPTGWLVAAPTALAVVVAAALAPTKFMDQPVEHELSAETLSVVELEHQLRLYHRADDRLPEAVIHLPSRRPTWKQLDAALHATGLRLRIGLCANGSSLLFGSSWPLGLWIEPAQGGQ